MAADNGKTEGEKAGHAAGTVPPPLEYSGNEISAETNAGKKRWMLAFNDLPSNKRTAVVKGLESKLADVGNFINFDEGVKDAINSTTKKGFWASLFGGGDVTIKFGSAEAELADRQKDLKIKKKKALAKKLVEEKEKMIREFRFFHGITIQSEGIQNIVRTLRAQWRPELIDDLNTVHTIDAEVELTRLLSEQIAEEIDNEIISELTRRINGGMRA
jgi:hypothetical protein